MEIACMSQLKQSGIPGEGKTQAPVLSTSILKRVDKRGISSTLYNPQKNLCCNGYSAKASEK